MRTDARLGIIVIMLVLVGGVACNDSSPEAPHHRGHQALSDSIQAGYERLQRAYDSTDAVPPAMRQMHGAMGQMHAQMHGRMQGERGMGGGMHERGMMDGGRGMHGMHEGQGMHDGPQHERRRNGGMRDSVQMWEWHQQMMGMHAQMAQMHAQSGSGRLAEQHRKMERQHRQMMGTLPSESEPSEPQAESSSEAQARPVSGEDLYVQHCASCHGREGMGMSTTFPPLAGSEWLEGEEDTAIQILLHGLKGEIQVKGQSYDGVMPAFGRRLSDQEIAAILSYVRSSWDNEGETVEPGDVREVRRQHADRTEPWTAAQLLEEE